MLSISSAGSLWHVSASLIVVGVTTMYWCYADYDRMCKYVQLEGFFATRNLRIGSDVLIRRRLERHECNEDISYLNETWEVTRCTDWISHYCAFIRDTWMRDRVQFHLFHDHAQTLFPNISLYFVLFLSQLCNVIARRDS